MAERVDVSRMSVAECMALGGGAGEAAEEEGLHGLGVSARAAVEAVA